MRTSLIDDLRSLLYASDAKLRKHWAERIVNENIQLQDLMILLHGEKKTAQRFMWLVGDLLELDPGVVQPCVPMLFSLRDQMPFPGMRRSVAKCLWLTNFQPEIETEAIEQLFEWLRNDEYTIGCKHYSAKALFDLAEAGRIETEEFSRILKKQSRHDNEAHASRMLKMHLRLENLNNR